MCRLFSILRNLLFKTKQKNNKPNFWGWFFCKQNNKTAGYNALIDYWLTLHIFIGLFFAALITGQDFIESAKNVIIPFASILTGITFAWSGNITALLTTKEIGRLSALTSEGIVGYVFSVQRSILIIFITLLLWVLVGLGLIQNFFWRFFVFAISSLAIRESWSVIMFAQLLTIYRERVAKALKDKAKKEKID